MRIKHGITIWDDFNLQFGVCLSSDCTVMKKQISIPEIYVKALPLLIFFDFQRILTDLYILLSPEGRYVVSY